MTVTVTTNKDFHDGNAVTTAFDFTFKVFNTNEVKAKIDGVDTAAFTVVLNPAGDGGTVTFTSAPAAGSGNVLIYRDIAYTQESRIPNENKIARGTLETVMDKAMMAVQQVKEIADRAVVRSLSSTSTASLILPEPSPGTAIIWNDDGTAFINSTVDLENVIGDVSALVVSATEQATAAAQSATAAAQSATDAANSAAQAAASNTSATTQAGMAATSASNASTSASSASTSAAAAAQSATDAATSAAQAAAAANGLSSKGSVRVATTAALTVTYNNGTAGVGATLTNAGAQAAISIDSVSLSSADRVLVKDQAAPAQNGIYTVTTVGNGSTNWVLTRATDYDQSAEILPLSYCSVSEGTTNTGKLFFMNTNGTITVGTTAIGWTAYNLSIGTVTSVATSGLATGGPITGTGTINVPSASVGQVITGTNTAQAVTSDSLAAIWEKGSDIASGSTITIPSSGGGFFHVTGTTTINGISESTTKTGRTVRLLFEGILTLTHNGTSFILPTGANIVTQAGDCAVFTQEGSNNWRCTGYLRKDGTALATTAGSSPFSDEYDTGQQTYTNGSTATYSHALGGFPKLTSVELQCTVPEFGYSSGDCISLSYVDATSTVSAGIVVAYDNDELWFNVGDNGVAALTKDTNVGCRLTAARWVYRVRAWI